MSSTTATAPADLSVRLIGKSNGFGLSRDLRLLAEALGQCGCGVQVQAVGRSDARGRRSWVVQSLARADAWLRRRAARPVRQSPGRLNLMLEHVWPQGLRTGSLNIAIPNPEWFDRRDRRLLAALDGVWAKTRYAQRLFETLGCRTAYIGFNSDDRYEPQVARERTFFHLAGKSRRQGTDRLLALWARHPEWPPLIVLYHEWGRGGRAAPALTAAVRTAANIRWHLEYLPDEQLRRLQNASRFHLCPSEAEGWGHYIAEAMSVGAVTVTLDAPPMNELVQPERGVLIACSPRGRQNLSDTFGFDDTALEQAIERVLQLDEGALTRLGEAARRWFLDNRGGFPQRVAQALEQVATWSAR